jgi:ABC-2 type transport system ATP-binding protein
MGVSKRLGGREALHGISFDVPPATLCGVTGPNGAGKSTLLAIMAGLRRPSEGSVTIDGVDVRAARGSVGIVAQDVEFPPTLRVRDIVRYVGRSRSFEGRGLTEKTVTAAVGLPDDRAYVGALSGGQQRRLALATGLVNAPPALLLDEATANLDAEIRDQVWFLLRAYGRQGGCAVVTSHLDDLCSHVGRVIGLDAGRIVDMADNITVADTEVAD